MRPSAVSGQAVQEVSYLDEIDDDNVLNALRNLQARTSGVAASPVEKPPKEESLHEMDSETITVEEEKKERDDVDESDGFWKGIKVPRDNLDIREEDEDEQKTPFDHIMDIFSCTSFAACDSILLKPDIIEARVVEARKKRAEKQKPKAAVVNKRLQKLSSRNRKLSKGPIEDDDTAAAPEEWVTEEQQQRLANLHLEELEPMLELMQKTNAFLFLGRYDVLELHSVSQMLNRMEENLESKLETMRGYGSGRSYVPRSKRNAADVPTLAGKMKRVYGLIQEVSEELVLQEFVQHKEGQESVAGSTWADHEEQSTLADTLTLDRAIMIPPEKNNGKATTLPAITSFLNFQDKMQCGDGKAVHNIAETGLQCGDETAQIIELWTENDDGSLETYDFSAMDRQIVDHVHAIRNKNKKPLPGTIAVAGNSTIHASKRKIDPVDDVENRGIEVFVNKSDPNGKPPLPNASPDVREKRDGLIKKLSSRLRKGGGSISGSLSSRSLNSRSKNGSTRSAASKQSKKSQKSESRKSVPTGSVPTGSVPTGSVPTGDTSGTAPIANLAPGNSDLVETDQQSEPQPKEAQSKEVEGEILWASAEVDAASGEMSNTSSPSVQASKKSLSSAQPRSPRVKPSEVENKGSLLDAEQEVEASPPSGADSADEILNDLASLQLSDASPVGEESNVSHKPELIQPASAKPSKPPTGKPPSGLNSKKARPTPTTQETPGSVQLNKTSSGQFIISSKPPAGPSSRKARSVQPSKKSPNDQISQMSVVSEDSKLPRGVPRSLVVTHNTDDACSVLSAGSISHG